MEKPVSRRIRPRKSYIEKDDLLRFMIKEEVDLVLPLIEGGETGKITRNAFTEWVLLVEEIDLLTTKFLKLDNEKVFYPNATLISKPISNYYRSPDMGDPLYTKR
uniref:Mechanosensitive ion channel MscS domain-containing protein n=1 Tax=Brassica oleracea var. oleracea TaxID=109376 RepID=A0A0D3EE10_BRAOL